MCEEAVVLAGGPSLTVEDVSAALAWRDRSIGRRIAVVANNTYLIAPDADVLYASDKMWFDVHAVDVSRKFRGSVWTGNPAVASMFGLNLVKRVNGGEMPEDGICFGAPMPNSGVQCLFFAALAGARRIGMLGFDGGPVNGKTHWHGSHPKPLQDCDGHEAWPETFRRAAEQLRGRGSIVTNCTPGGSIDAFGRKTFADWASI